MHEHYISALVSRVVNVIIKMFKSCLPVSWRGVCSQASNDRWIVCADFHDLVEFVKGCSEENKLEAEQCTYENVREWGLTKMTDTDLLKMKEKKILLGSKISKGIISYIPAHYMVWEWIQGAAVHGVRFSFAFKWVEQVLQRCRHFWVRHHKRVARIRFCVSCCQLKAIRRPNVRRNPIGPSERQHVSHHS